MRATAVLLNVVIAGAVGGGVGYYLADTARAAEVARLQHELDLGAVRAKELQAQLQDALTTRAALAQEARRLQEDLTERLRRLENAAAQLSSPPAPSSPPGPEGGIPKERSLEDSLQ